VQRDPQAPLISDRARWAAGRQAAARGRVDGAAHGSVRLADLMAPGRAHRLHRGGPDPSALGETGPVPRDKNGLEKICPVEWHLMSAGHAHAYHGRMTAEGTVSARCALTFRP
jgi:hypothetical protein